jgi:membrane protein implicated in regulation of membrane protease activity
MGGVPPMRSSIGAIILQLLGGIIPFVIFRWVLDISVWLSIVFAILVVGILMAIWERYLRNKNPV